ncbi:MAG: T9SS type A sorting domain-containing protein [Bacteroidales bacterium]|nr:T9SS type A sorting domain-containing protein [Bacteroidales bacterium]
MKKFKIITLILCLVFVGGNIHSQKNNYHGVNDPALIGDVKGGAYAISELDMNLKPSGDVTFISAFIYEDLPANKTYLHFRRTKACLDYHENAYDVAVIPYVTPWWGANYTAFSVNDVKEVKGTGKFEVIICGTFVEKEGYVAIFDRHFNPITNFNTYYGMVHTFHSIVEIPGRGFLVCGEGYYSNTGVIVTLDYNLNLISSYSSPDYKFTDIVYNARDNYAYVAGYSKTELCAYGLNVADMFAGNPNPVFAGMTYVEPNYNIDWNISKKDDVKIINRYDKQIAIAASGISNVTGRNMGIFHENEIDGSNPMANIIYTISPRSNTYLKGLVQMGNRYNLLLQEEAGTLYYPHIVDMDPRNNSWDVLRITASVNPSMKLLKRDACKMLDIFSFTNSMINYSSCHASGFPGLAYQPIEIYRNLPVQHLPPSVSPAPPLYQTFGNHDPNYFPTQGPWRSFINSSIFFIGDCFPSCTKKATAEYEELSIEELAKDENAVMIYNNSIEIFDISDYSHYQIFDIMGRQINNDKIDKNTISIQAIPNGTYFIRLIKTNGETEHHKFMRQ